MVAIFNISLENAINISIINNRSLNALAQKKGLSGVMKAIESSRFRRKQNKKLDKIFKAGTDFIDMQVTSTFKGTSIQSKGHRGLRPDVIVNRISTTDSFLDTLFSDDKSLGTIEVKSIFSTLGTEKDISSSKVFIGSISFQRDSAKTLTNFIELQPKTEGTREFGESSATLSIQEVNKLIDRFIRSATKKNIIKIIEGTPGLKNNIISKASNILIPYTTSKGVFSKIISFKWNEIKKLATFNIVRLGKDIKLEISYPERFVKQLLNIIVQANKFVVVELAKNFKKNDIFSNIIAVEELNGYDYGISFVKGSVVVTKLSNFLNSKEISNKLSERKRESISRFASTQELSASVQKSLFSRMPKGPPRGKPLSDTMLTNRTGTFVRSVTAFLDFKNKLISYYYDPKYWVHEVTSRDPRVLIKQSIRNLVTTTVSKQFNIVKRG